MIQASFTKLSTLEPFFRSQVAHAIVTLRQSCPKFRVEMIFLLSQLLEPKRNEKITAFPDDASLSRTSSKFSLDFPSPKASLLMETVQLLQ